MQKVFYAFCLLLFASSSMAQEPRSKSESGNIAAIVLLDSFVVTAKREGFKVEEFIELVQKDESFYAAFQNLRKVSYRADNHLEFFNKSEEKIAQYDSKTRQQYENKCRTMQILSQKDEGKYFKRNGKYRYYTSKMYDQVFFTHGAVCESEATMREPSKPKGIRKHISELKKLIFQPGEKVDVPIIGGKTAIFSEKMMPYYDYSIRQDQYRGQLDCYVFAVHVKPEFEQKKEGKTVIKYLETYFERKTFQVLGRKYQLRYQSAFFDFDVEMDIELTKIGNLYLPEKVQYNGVWNIPSKKPEDGSFQATFYDFVPSR